MLWSFDFSLGQMIAMRLETQIHSSFTSYDLESTSPEWIRRCASRTGGKKMNFLYYYANMFQPITCYYLLPKVHKPNLPLRLIVDVST